MQDTLPIIAIIVIAYLMGSIPVGMLVARTKGIDLRRVGSGNIGATNVLRSVGRLPAIITLIGDSLKGILAVLLCRAVACGELYEGVTALAAVSGHIFSVFLGFRGGKGVATGFGVLLVYSPGVAAITLVVWLLTASLSRYSSLAAIVAYASLPVVFLLLHASLIKIVFAMVLAALIIFRHSGNIKRILNGTESRIGERIGSR